MIQRARRCKNVTHVCAVARCSASVKRVSGVRVCAVYRTGPRVQVHAVVRAMAIPALISMLLCRTETEGGVKNAINALRVICTVSDGRAAAVAAGVPAAVVTAMATCNARARFTAAHVLASL